MISLIIYILISSTALASSQDEQIARLISSGDHLSLKQVLETIPDPSEVSLTNLAIVNESLGSKGEAIWAVNKALLINPRFSPALELRDLLESQLSLKNRSSLRRSLEKITFNEAATIFIVVNAIFWIVCWLRDKILISFFSLTIISFIPIGFHLYLKFFCDPAYIIKPNVSLFPNFIQHEPIATLSEGERVDVISTQELGDQNWLQIRLDDIKGWIKESELRKLYD